MNQTKNQNKSNPLAVPQTGFPVFIGFCHLLRTLTAGGFSFYGGYMLVNKKLMPIARMWSAAQSLARLNKKIEENRKMERIIAIASLTLVAIFCFAAISMADNSYTNDQIVNAVYKAEGGKNASYPYGIRLVSCKSESQCRAICLRTIKNNRKRYALYGHKKYRQFICFLGSRYCPTTGRNLSSSEKCLNGNWVKNVMRFLERGV